MKLTLKTLEKNNRSLFIYYPQGGPRTPFKRCSITILRESADEASVRCLLDETGLAELAEKEQIILSFPNPTASGWNAALDPAGPDDLAALLDMQASLEFDREIEPAQAATGVPPSFDTMLQTYHPMNDTKYVAGVGSGASMALALAACKPPFVAAVLAVGGQLSAAARTQATFAPLPVYLVNADMATRDYFIKANNAEITASGQNAGQVTYACAYNPLQQVITAHGLATLTRDLINSVFADFFRKIRRTNTGKLGDVEPRVDLVQVGFEIFLEDTRLGDQDGIPHTWFTHVPASAKANPAAKVPLMVFFHGGSDNPQEAADMTKFHELGEREGFITVYPWGSNRASWNSNMDLTQMDDMAFSVALIQYMIANYPVDAQRVYLSGFSNGAAMAQIVAMVHPELIAAICHIDANWPGDRVGVTNVDYKTFRPTALALQKKETYDWRVPVWYTYGNREPSYPVYKGCTQQNQYDFWKLYNNITIKPTPPRETPDPSGCGVPGDEYELLKPSARHPHHEYDVQRFFTNDPVPRNYYNYIIMRDKGHEVAEKDPTLGWQFVKQFKRNPDGSVGRV
jgi:poly(3-hydroxybutyrate) depolymerase